MPVTVLYISQGLRTKALKPKWLRLPHGLAAGRERQWLCALHKADEPSCGRGGGYRQVFIPPKMTLHQAPQHWWRHPLGGMALQGFWGSPLCLSILFSQILLAR